MKAWITASLLQPEIKRHINVKLDTSNMAHKKAKASF